MTFKPMLASPADLNNLKFPLYASPKLDGIRAVVRDGVVLSRTLKPIPNKHVQRLFSVLEHHDGELIVGLPTADDCFRQTTSGVMSVDGEPDVTFYVFDHVQDMSAPYSARAKLIKKPMNSLLSVVVVEQRLINNLEELLAFEAECLAMGYEGLILRSIDGHYKCGRSTTREGILLKLKRFEDSEALIVSLVEQQHNGNEATKDNLGRTKRSSHKENKTGKGMLGAFTVAWQGLEFEIGTGMDAALRAQIWANPDAYIGKIVKFKYFPVGVKEKPRHPVFLGFRDVRDM